MCTRERLRPLPRRVRATRDDLAVPQRVILPRQEVGLFSLVCQVLGKLVEAADRGESLVTWFGVPSGWSPGAGDAWTCFFEPVSELTLADVVEGPLPGWVDDARPWDFTPLEHFRPPPPDHPPERLGALSLVPGAVADATYPWRVLPPFGDVDRARRVVAPVIDRVRPRPELVEQADAFAAEHFAGRPMVAVHARGVEKSRERVIFAPDGVLGETALLRVVDAQLAASPGAGLFLATDAQRIAELFRDRYGDRVVSTSAQRLAPDREGTGLHGSTGARADPVAHGREAVVDCLLLSRADVLVHEYSNLSTAALLFNPRLRSVNVLWQRATDHRRARLQRWLSGYRDRSAVARRLARRLNVDGFDSAAWWDVRE
jgi:hypothetical protein